MKKLQNLKDSKKITYSELAGFGLKKERIIGVNIELLWEVSQSEKQFIRLFSEYFTHEWLHLFLRGIGQPIQEEVIIRKLLGQSFSPKEKKYYAKFYP